jgi:tetratricopeptide (TPR) repeat protein
MHVLIKAGKDVSAIYAHGPEHMEGHFLLAGNECAFETTSTCFERAAFPLSKLNETYPFHRKCGADALFAADLNVKGRLLAEQDCYYEAIDCFNAALAIIPDYLTALCNKGHVFQKRQMLREAADCYLMVLEACPGYAVASLRLGSIVAESGGPLEKELSFYRAAIAANPRCKEARILAHCKMGAAFTNKGRFQEAAEQFKNALRLDPHDVRALYDLGLTLKQQSDYKGSAECFRKVMAIDPKREDVVRLLNEVQKAGDSQHMLRD